VPRVKCSEHGVVTVTVHWAKPGSGFTALFEALVIDWLKEASVQAVSRRMGLSWNAIDGIMQRAVSRGLARRVDAFPERIGVDETSFRKRHDYVTVVSDQDNSTVLHVADDRTQDSLKAYYTTLSEEQKAAIESVSMDMWPPISARRWRACPVLRRRLLLTSFMLPSIWVMQSTRCGELNTRRCVPRVGMT